MPKIKIAILIVNFNNYQDTFNCLSSLKILKSVDYHLHTILVDNASTDGSFQKIKRQFPRLEYISSPHNLGFAGGNNLGINLALKQGYNYIMLLNNDTIVSDPNFITKLLVSRLDIAAPVLKFKRDKKTVYDFGGRVDRFLGRNTHFEYCTFPTHFPSADYYSGTCLLINRRVFKRIGLLNERYFMYFEDVDFCLKAGHSGLQLGLVPQAILTHKLSATTSKLGNKYKLKLLATSHRMFVISHLTHLAWPIALAYNLYLTLKSI